MRNQQKCQKHTQNPKKQKNAYKKVVLTMWYILIRARQTCKACLKTCGKLISARFPQKSVLAERSAVTTQHNGKPRESRQPTVGKAKKQTTGREQPRCCPEARLTAVKCSRRARQQQSTLLVVDTCSKRSASGIRGGSSGRCGMRWRTSSARRSNRRAGAAARPCACETAVFRPCIVAVADMASFTLRPPAGLGTGRRRRWS